MLTGAAPSASAQSGEMSSALRASEGKTIGESVPTIGGGTPSGVFFVGIILAVALIPFFAFREVGRAIGERALHSLMFTGGPKAAAFRSGMAQRGR